jgi:RNA polymerase sigma-70 factor (ECF subfamily)
VKTALESPAAVDALFARFRSTGDPAALAALFDRTAPHLFRIALSVAPDAATAEEAVQETFLAVLQDARRCDPSEPVMPWLASVLRHKVLDARRRERRVPDPLRLEPRLLAEDPADAADRRAAVDRVRTAIDRLPEPYRTVALLRWEYGLEPGEIAHARGEPPGTVRSTLSRALVRLRSELGGAAVLAVVLGARPADGLAAIRRAVLAKAGAGAAAAAGAAGLVVGGILVSKTAVAAALAAAFVLGGIAGGSAVQAIRGRETAARPSPAAPPSVPAIGRPARAEPPSPAPAPAAPAPPTGTPAPSSPGEGPSPVEAARRKADLLLDGLDGTWFTAWKVGGALAASETPDAVLDVLRARWAGLPRIVDRRNLMKGFAFSQCAWRLDVLDLGARDGDPAVRDWAWDYLEPYAGRRFDGDPGGYAAWRSSVAGAPAAGLLARTVEGILESLRAGPPSARPDLLRRLLAATLRVDRSAPLRGAVAAAMRDLLADAAGSPDPGPLLAVLRAAGAHREPAIREAILARLRSPDPALAGPAARALADLGDPRDAGPLVDALEAHARDAAAREVVAALVRLAEPGPDRGSDPAAWREWWDRNRDRIERAPPAEEER